MTPVKNIIFDLGGVLLTLHINLTYEGFAALGVPDFKGLFDSYQGAPFIEQFETGHLTETQFIQAAQQYCRPGTTSLQVITAWNAMLGHFGEEKVLLLRQLSAQYRLFLFSNTNSIHYRLFQQRFSHQTGLPNIDVLFEKAYFSHLFGYRKPQPEGFLTIAAQHNLLPAETLFIDDGAIHIEAARQLGFQCFHVTEQSPVNSIQWNLEE
jgi:glucose-1-phosphatase